MDKLIEDFLNGIREIEIDLIACGFLASRSEKLGVGYLFRYESGQTTVEFLFGPSDWDIEMIVYTSTGKYAFKDLLAIPLISEWVNQNRYTQEGQRDIKKELGWYVSLLKFSLPLIE